MGMSLLAPQRGIRYVVADVILYDDTGVTDGYMIPGNALIY